MADTHSFDTDVLVVGAGPTGLVLANTLARSGIQHIIVDKLASGQNTSRAAVIHAHTLEVLENLGVTERLTAEGLKLSRFTVRDRDHVLAPLDFGWLATPHPYLLMLPQDRTEAILRDKLEQAGGRVRWCCDVCSLKQTPLGVEASASTPEGQRTIRARYAIGADGMHSVVRQDAGIDFEGGRYEESFVLADVDMVWGHGHDEVMLFFAPAGLVVVAPLPDGRFRIVATLADAPERPGVDDVQALLDERGPIREPAKVTRVHWGSRFRVHHRLAERYRCGRFLLIGDAAHVHSPAGGQGMNTGIVDAWVLGRLLADVLSGRRPPTDLDRYESLRRPAAAQVLKTTGRLTRMATVRSKPKRAIRNLALKTLWRLPPVKHRIEMNLSGLNKRAAAELPEA